jgi:NAD(P)H-dependent flavin oxidoreductase YrpB (nitropropane dioxygenase family)
MLLNSKYPILVPAMNRVSDVRLALACYEAGIYPSLSVMSYIGTDGRCRFVQFEQDLRDFIQQTGTTDLLISLNTRVLQSVQLLNILKTLNLTTIEIIDAYIDTMPIVDQIRTEFKFKVLLKMTHPGEKLVSRVDGIILKGSDGAGTAFDNTGPLVEMVKNFKKQFPNKFVIATGGVGSSEQINELISVGADMVGVGTRYAASVESSISQSTKLRMINATWNDTEKIKESNQNSLIFKKLDIADDSNNTKSLELGIKHGIAGHIFVGKAIDQIKEIKTVKEITEELIKDL